MRVIKPMKLGVLHRPFEHSGRVFFSVGVFMFFDFAEPDQPLLEMELWKMLGEEIGDAMLLDEAMPKPSSEVLVWGDAFCPDGKPRTAMEVRLTVGDAEQPLLSKVLYAVGDRVWRRGSVTDPEPFTRMSLDWRGAFGGPAFEQNPLGKGAAPVRDAATGEEQHPLPNVEHPDRLVTSPQDQPEPTSLQPVSLAWPQRRALSGTYDKRWLNTHFPGFPEDLDLHMFQMAQRDQWLTERFAGGERFSVSNMHADKPEVKGTLPTLAARCFLQLEGSGEDDALHELTMQPETLHLFPGREQGVMIYRGMTEIQQDDAHDVRLVMIAAEERGAPKPLSHYTEVVSRRTGDRGHLHALRDRDLLPQSVNTAIADLPADPTSKTEGLMATNMRRRMELEHEKTRLALVEQGIDPAEHGVGAELPAQEEIDLDNLDVAIEKAEKDADAKKKEAEAKRDAAMAEARETAEAQGLDFDEMLDEARRDAGGAPKFRAATEMERLQDQLQLSRNAGVPMPEVEAQLADPELFAKLQATEDRLFQAYRDFAQHAPAAMTLEGDEGARIRAEVERAVAEGESLADRDLTGADLQGMDLQAAQLAGAFLEAADLTGCNLAGVDLSRAVLTRARLAEANLSGATLVDANLAEADLTSTVLTGVDLSDAKLDGASLRGASFAGATLDGASLLETKLAGTSWEGARANGVLFIKNDMSGGSFKGAKLDNCTFIELVAHDADFSGASLAATTWVTCKADRACFDDASLDNMRVVTDSAFAESSFKRASMKGANLRGTDLTGADFMEADLEASDLSECAMRGAVLERASAPSSSWIRADLSLANLIGMNAMMALMSKANLEGAKLVGANLFRADLARVRTDDDTSFADALLTQARITQESIERGDG